MVAALIIRRKQLAERGFADPFGLVTAHLPLPVPGGGASPANGNGAHTPVATNGTPGTVCYCIELKLDGHFNLGRC
jgi:hypothetical protein